MNAKEPLFCRQRQIEEVLLEEVLQKIAADMILPAAIRTLWFYIRRKQTAAKV